MRLNEIAKLGQKMKFHDFIDYIVREYPDGSKAAANLALLHDDEERLHPVELTAFLRKNLIPISIRSVDKYGNDVVFIFDEVTKD